MFLQFGFVIFWRKDFGAKATHKMLVKMPPGSRASGSRRSGQTPRTLSCGPPGQGRSR
jgi:hypothetical protein